jgi:hypothetical protein
MPDQMGSSDDSNKSHQLEHVRSSMSRDPAGIYEISSQTHQKFIQQKLNRFDFMENEFSSVPRSSIKPMSWRFLTVYLLIQIPWHLTTTLLYPILVLEPNYMANLLSKAKRIPESTAPQLTFFPVLYDQESRELNPFMVNSLGNCQGLFS